MTAQRLLTLRFTAFGGTEGDQGLEGEWSNLDSLALPATG